ncbi:hypothetical protein ACFFMM_19365 [Micromonospora chaiyaphumensis]|uniref:Aspartate kinase n=1 Tax=Micromonospora chaiyaphumensis TaxID=307119 RepID=A0A1C4VZU3_9ACTN|nr:hypothetical protein [Micromonospora chaiyaphumensis]SCE89301.1 hypothetical protein GA0070214_10357 [Micromonospora chaiyaphumensis]
MEGSIVRRLTHDHTRVLVSVSGLPGTADVATVLAAVGRAGAAAEMLTLLPAPDGTALSFVTARSDGPPVLAALAEARPAGGAAIVRCRDDVARLTLCGEGIRADPRVLPTFQQALHRVGVTPLALSVSNTLVEAVCAAAALHRALRSLAAAFDCEAGFVPAAAPRPRSVPLPADRPPVAARPAPPLTIARR